MILFHQRLPCSENFFRYFKNYDRYMEEKRTEEAAQRGEQATSSGTTDISSESRSPVRSIESPKYSLSLSPIQKFLKVHSPRRQSSPTMTSSQTISQEFPFDP